MADSPLNNSWPSFSKLWMKRWSFKRGSECKPCSQQCAPPVSGTGSSSSLTLSPASIAEDVFFSDPSEEKEAGSTESDYEYPGLDVDSSVEDLLELSSSLRGSEYFKDLEAGHSVSAAPRTHLSVLISPVGERQCSPKLHLYQTPDSRYSPCSGPAKHNYTSLGLGSTMDTLPRDSMVVVNTTVYLNGPERGHKDMEDMDSDMDSIPMLVRSMSTSRRHSWGVPVSPVDLGRRFSLDTSAIDSDGDRDERDLSQSSHYQSFTYPQCSDQSMEESSGQAERDYSKPKETELALMSQQSDRSGRTLYSRSEILATNERSKAAHVSRILETSKQAARVAGEEQDLEESLQSAEGQCHMLMVQKVLRELKQYHGAKRRSSITEVKQASGSVTWYEFLSNENEEEEDRAEKLERGTKVKRTLSSLRNRMTGSFAKDKGKNREKEQQREREKDREKEREFKEREKVRRSSSSGHQLVRGSFSTWATCSLCSKTLQRKHGLQCMNFHATSIQGRPEVNTVLNEYNLCFVKCKNVTYVIM